MDMNLCNRKFLKTDFSKFTFYSICFKGNVGLLALVTEKAKCCQEQNQRDRHGNTALHMAAQFPPENEMLIEVSRILLENEVDPFLENKDGKTAKDLASPKHQKLIGLLEHDGI